MFSAVRLLVTCVLALLPLSRALALAAPPEPARAASADPVSQQVPEGEVSVAPVELDGRVLFSVRGVSAKPAPERAAAIAGRIQALAEDATFDPATLQAEETAGVSRIVSADGRLVMNVYDADSVHEGFSREGVSMAILLRVRQAIADHRAARTTEALLSAALHSLGALLALAAGLALLVWTSRRIEARLEQRYRARVPRLGIGSFEILRAERIWVALRNLISLVRWTIGLVLVFVCLRYALGRFPQTRGLAGSLDDLVMGPLESLGLGAVGFLPDLIVLVILFFITRWFMRLTKVFFQAVERGNVKLKTFEPDWGMPTYRLVRVGIIAFALVVAYPYIPGSESAAFKGVSLFLGVLISLGSSSAISNIVAGYLLTYRRAFHVGDRVRIDDVIGEVTAIRLQVTHVRTNKNESVTIPNSSILASKVVNYSTLAATEGLILHVTVGIGYETPWRQVEAMLLQAAERTPGLKRDPPAFVQQVALGDFAVTYELNAFCNEPHQMVSLRTAMHRSVLDLFNEYGVQIMTPAYEGDPAEPKVVPREKWYAAPAARTGPDRSGS